MYFWETAELPPDYMDMLIDSCNCFKQLNEMNIGVFYKTNFHCNTFI